MILSRYPLSNVENYVLPGTWNQRTITVATATLPNEAEVDIYCNHLSPIFTSFTFPYTGQYGSGATGAAGWEAEQALQIEKLVGLVGDRSDGRPAIILGDMNTGQAGLGEGLDDEGPDSFDRLSEAFTFGVAADFAGPCTFCSDNTNNDADTADVWIDHIFVSGIEASDILATERTFDEATVATDSGMVPPSDHYGLRTRLSILSP